MLTKLRIGTHSLAIETGRYMVQQKYQLIKDFVNSAPQMWKMRCIFFSGPQYNLLRNEYNIPFINIYDFNKKSMILLILQ